MEESKREQRLAGFRKFLNGFVVERDAPLIQDDPILFRGSTVGGFRLQATDVPAEILDWALLYLHQRKCPQDLAWILAKEVQSRIEALLPSIVPPVTNGGTTDADSPDEGQYLLDSTLLYGEMLGHLQEACSYLRDSQEELALRNSVCKTSLYQTSLVALRNTRRKMEDRHVVIPDLNALCGLVDCPPQSYYAVFDGHSGAEAANFCSAHLHWNLVQHPKFEFDPEAALKDTFAFTEEQFLQRSQREGIKSGCTAVCCLIRDRILHLAWVGDSQAFLVKKGMPITIMAPHKPDRTDEKERVEKMGGCVMHVGTWRVNGILAVSRALGDFEHKPCVSSEPDVVHIPLDGEEDFLVLACDGLWDTLAPSDVTAAIYHFINQEIEDMDDIAGQVAQQAIERGSTDNVTVIIVFLKDLKTITAQSSVTSFSNEAMLNHSGNPFHTVGNVVNSAGLILENGNGEYDLSMKNNNHVHTNGPQGDIFHHHHGGLMPEQTSISELPTPPIEDLIEAGDDSIITENAEGSMNPFESGEEHVHGNHAKEIASAILNSALESASQEDVKDMESDGLIDSSSKQAFGMDSELSSDHNEINQLDETVIQNANFIETSKAVEHHVQNKSDEVDFLMHTHSDITSELSDLKDEYSEHVSDAYVPIDPFSSLQGQNETCLDEDLVPGKQETDFFLNQVPVGMKDFPNEFQMNLESGIPLGSEQSNEYENSVEPDMDFKRVSDMQNVIESKTSDLQLDSESSVMQDLSPEMLKEAQLELEDVQSKLIQSVQELSGLDLLSDESIPSERSIQEQESDFQAKLEVEKDDGLHRKGPADFEREFASEDQDNQERELFTTMGEEYREELQNYNPFNQPQQTQDLFGFPEETPSALRSLQGVPEMIGIYEDVPGIQTSEPLLAPEPIMTSQKEVLAAFEDILVPSSPDQASETTIAELLSPSDSLEMNDPKQNESVFNVMETTLGVQENDLSVNELVETKAEAVPVELALSADSPAESATSVDIPERHAPFDVQDQTLNSNEVLEAALVPAELLEAAPAPNEILEAMPATTEILKPIPPGEELQELTVLAPDSVEVLEEQAPVSVEVLEEQAPVSVEVLEEHAPTSAEVLEEHAPTSAEVLQEQAPASAEILEEPAPVLTEVLEELTPALAEVLEEPTPGSADILEEQAPAPAEVLEEPTPVPAEVLEEPTPIPAGVLEEPTPVPAEVLEESTPVPAEILEESTPVPAEILEESTPVPAEILEESTPVLPEILEQLSHVPTAALEEPTPVPDDILSEPISTTLDFSVQSLDSVERPIEFTSIPLNLAEPTAVLDNAAEPTHPVATDDEKTPTDLPAEPTEVDIPPSLESAKVEIQETETVKAEIIGLENEPGQNSSLVDIIAPQIGNPEVVANLLASDVPPTPEVVLEKIPDGVPEADGVTEDSDSEKDGGWSYVSTKGKDAEEPATKNDVVAATTEVISVIAPVAAAAAVSTAVKKAATSKEAVKTSAGSKTAGLKATENKLKAKPSPSKPVASPTSTTLKKTPSDPVKKATPTTLVKPKPSPTTAPKLSTRTSTSGITSVSKDTEVKSSVTKSATSTRPASTLAKKATPTAKPPTAPLTKTTPTASAAVAKTTTKPSTLKPTRPATATTVARSTAPTSARPTSSTLNKPAAKPTATAAKPTSMTTTTISKKPAATATSKTTTTAAKVPPARLSGTMSKTSKPSTETKQTKDTVNKHLVTQPGTLKSKQTSPALNKTSNKPTTPTLSKPSPRTSTAGKVATKSGTVSGKPITKPPAKEATNETAKAEKEETAKPEPEKGSLEEKGKDNQAVDSGLASPESPVSPQLSLVNGNHHQSEAQIEDKATAAVLEQAELN